METHIDNARKKRRSEANNISTYPRTSFNMIMLHAILANHPQIHIMAAQRPD